MKRSASTRPEAAAPTADDAETRRRSFEADKAAARNLERKKKRVKELETEIATGEAELERRRDELKQDPGGNWAKLAESRQAGASARQARGGRDERMDDPLRRAGRRLVSRALAVLVAVALSGVTAVVAGCSHKATDDGTAPAAARALPPLTLTDETPELMLTWIDDKGVTHVELRPQDVPAPSRALVRVVVSDREDGTHDLFYVADLTAKGDDGSYPTRTLRRHDWEAENREAPRRLPGPHRAPPPPPAGSSGSGPAPFQAQGAATVIIYGASWCGPCHQAADFLKSKGVPYVLKDVETTPGAAAEMQEKLARAGRHGGSIPVIDVRGQILVGFSPGSLAQALSRVPAGTTL